MSVKVIIFDFDGTVADTFDTLVGICNHLAVDFGYEPVSQEDIVKLKNLSSRQIIQQSGVSLYKLPLIVKKIKAELNNKIQELSPIPGMKDVLYELKQNHYKTGIITSNSKENVIVFLQNNGMQDAFDFLYSETKIFGKSKAIHNFLKRNKMNAEEVIYVGDETRDIEAAKKTRIKMIAVSWGFNSKEVLARHSADFLIDQPRELLTVIESLQTEAPQEIA